LNIWSLVVAVLGDHDTAVAAVLGDLFKVQQH
jgi:hypothetical protein